MTEKLKDRWLLRETIDRVFEDAHTQADYIIGLYKCVYPEWDEIETIDGHPKINGKTNRYIFEKSMEFDRKLNKMRSFPDLPLMLGGGWMNSGFSVDDTLEDWLVEPAPFTRIKED